MHEFVLDDAAATPSTAAIAWFKRVLTVVVGISNKHIHKQTNKHTHKHTCKNKESF